MADNLGYTPGTGANIKTDQGGVSGAHMSVVKLASSAHGEETLVTADGDGLEVQIGKSIDLTTRPKGGDAWPVTDNGGSLTVDDGGASITVDAPPETPVAVRLSSGAAFVDAIPVTDNSGSLSVDDGGGALTVDGAVTAAQGAPVTLGSAWPTKISDGFDIVGISTVGAAKALKTDEVQSVLQQADKSSFTEGATKASPVAGVLNDTISADPTEDQAAALRITAKRGLHVNLRNVAGTEIGTVTTPIVNDLQKISGAAVGEANALPVSIVRGAQTRVTKSITVGAAETGTTVWDPATGKKFVITDVIVAMKESGRLTLFDGTDAAANRVFDGVFYGAVWHLNFQARPWASSTVDNILKATTDADAEATVTVHGYEV